MTRIVRTEDLKAHGVELLSPADPAFDLHARPLFTGNLAELLKIKPFLTLITNTTANTIVAFTLEWMTSSAGGDSVEYSQHKYPDALAACPVRGNEIRPGEQRLVPKSIELNAGLWGDDPTETFYLEQFSAWASEQEHVESLGIALDAVLFEDGSLLGPDKADIAAHFSAYFEAKQRLYKEIVTALDSGRSLEEALRPVGVLLANRPTFGEPLSIYPRLAAQDVNRWKEEFGLDSAGLFRQAIRSSPFLMKRLWD